MTIPIGTVTIREADTIWHERGGWFDARWHFSFDRYRDYRARSAAFNAALTRLLRR